MRVLCHPRSTMNDGITPMAVPPPSSVPVDHCAHEAVAPRSGHGGEPSRGCFESERVGGVGVHSVYSGSASAVDGYGVVALVVAVHAAKVVIFTGM